MDIANKATTAQSSLDAYNQRKAELAELTTTLSQCSEWLDVQAKTLEVEAARLQVEADSAELSEAAQTFKHTIETPTSVTGEAG